MADSNYKRFSFVIDNKGKKTECETIATYHDDNTNKDFIIYTDNTFDNNKKLNIYYSLYEKDKTGIKLTDIVLKSDKLIALEILKQVINDLPKQ